MIDVQQIPSTKSAATINVPASLIQEKAQPKKIGLPMAQLPSLYSPEFLFTVQKPKIIRDQDAGLAGTVPPYSDRVLHLPTTIQFQESVNSMMTDRMQRVLKALFPLLDQAARMYGVQVRHVVVSGYVDPEEDHDQVVVTQWVNLPEKYALSYWDQMGLFIDNALKALPSEFIPVADRIGISVEWDM